jgi:replication-associated recombination protein RarA
MLRLMRSEPQILAMHDELERAILRDGGECDRTAFTVLDWVCNALVPDSAVLDAVDEVSDRDDVEQDPDPADVFYALPQVVRSDDLDAAKDYLARIAEADLKELAAAARRLDRLCKAELKRRSVPR